MFRFAGSRVAPAALFDASLLDFLKDRPAAVLFFVSGCLGFHRCWLARWIRARCHLSAPRIPQNSDIGNAGG